MSIRTYLVLYIQPDKDFTLGGAEYQNPIEIGHLYYITSSKDTIFMS